MSYSLAAGRKLIDKDGITRLNTNDKMAHNLTTGINTTLPIPARSIVQGGFVDTTVSHAVGTCHPSCTEVTGSCRISYSVPSGGPQTFSVPANLWFTVKKDASFWLLMDGEEGGSFANRNTRPRQYYLYTLKLSGGNITLEQRIRIPTVLGNGTTYAVVAHDIELKLKAGTFT